MSKGMRKILPDGRELRLTSYLTPFAGNASLMWRVAVRGAGELPRDMWPTKTAIFRRREYGRCPELGIFYIGAHRSAAKRIFDDLIAADAAVKGGDAV